MAEKTESTLTIRNILITCFILSVLLTFSGISIRLQNESQNKSIIPVLDYYEFLNASKLENVELGDVLRRFKEAEVLTIAVGELPSGFEQKDLSYLKDMGFQLLLRPNITSKLEESYYENIIKKYGIKYIIFNSSEASANSYSINTFKDIIVKYKLIVGIIENSSQTGYINQPGLEGLVIDTHYAVNRAYIIPDSDLTKISSTEMFYRWLRSIVDRNIRFIYIRPLRNVKTGLNGNISETLNSVAEFNKYAALSGFTINKPIAYLSPKMPGGYHKFAVSFSLLFAFLLYIFYLFSPRIRYIITIAFFGAIAVTAADIFIGDNILRLWATMAAILYPSFSSLVFLMYLKNNCQKPLVVQILSSLGILIGINLFGMYTVVTCLCDLRFTFGMLVYSGVLISFILPVVFFGINYFSCFIGFENIKEAFKKLWKFKITARKLSLLIIFGFIFYVYIARSGNDMGISATKFELNFRELLEKYLLVRPRFKEFVIGYPSILVLIYLYKHFRKKEIAFWLGFLAVMGSVSMVNSFCHGFTPVLTSAVRTINGLVIGVSFGLLIVLLVHAYIIFYNKIIYSARE
jgi:hypothetical protein